MMMAHSEKHDPGSSQMKSEQIDRSHIAPQSNLKCSTHSTYLMYVFLSKFRAEKRRHEAHCRRLDVEYSIYILYMVRVIISAGLSAALNEIPEMIRRLQYLIIIARNLTPIFIEWFRQKNLFSNAQLSRFGATDSYCDQQICYYHHHLLSHTVGSSLKLYALGQGYEDRALPD